MTGVQRVLFRSRFVVVILASVTRFRQHKKGIFYPGLPVESGADAQLAGFEGNGAAERVPSEVGRIGSWCEVQRLGTFALKVRRTAPTMHQLHLHEQPLV